jgi:ribonuclease Z
MALHWRVLGAIQRDNALLVEVRRGQGVTRLLFDCGDGCLWPPVSYYEVGEVDHLLFSHLHMDHVGGFDSFLRVCYSREHKANHIWGPVASDRILGHKMQGFMWNLPPRAEVFWNIHELDEHTITSHQRRLGDHFASSSVLNTSSRTADGVILTHKDYSIATILLDHHTPSCGYMVRETNRRSLDAETLKSLGFTPGPWLKTLREDYSVKQLELNGQMLDLDDLRSRVISETPGEAIAYLTDFWLDDTAMARLVPFLQGVGTIICESQYLHQDLEYANRNRHLTSVQAAQLALAVGAQNLCLFHLSERYDHSQCQQLLAEAQAVFANTSFPGHWGIGAVVTG